MVKLNKKQNILRLVLLSITTLGIYYVIWFCSTQNQIHKQMNQGLSGVLHILLSAFTGGIYAVVWHFLVGLYIKRAGGKNRGLLYGLPFTVTFIVTLMFCITFIRNAIGIPTEPWLSYLIGGLLMFATMLISMAFIQSDINKISLQSEIEE